MSHRPPQSYSLRSSSLVSTLWFERSPISYRAEVMHSVHRNHKTNRPSQSAFFQSLFLVACHITFTFRITVTFQAARTCVFGHHHAKRGFSVHHGRSAVLFPFRIARIRE